METLQQDTLDEDMIDVDNAGKEREDGTFQRISKEDTHHQSNGPGRNTVNYTITTDDGKTGEGGRHEPTDTGNGPVASVDKVLHVPESTAFSNPGSSKEGSPSVTSTVLTDYDTRWYKRFEVKLRTVHRRVWEPLRMNFNIFNEYKLPTKDEYKGDRGIGIPRVGVRLDNYGYRSRLHGSQEVLARRIHQKGDDKSVTIPPWSGRQDLRQTRRC